jgi:serine/threonine-protein kinase PRP4
MELDLPSSPPPVEDILAARRAKRQAILAKYAGVASVAATVSSGPGPSSAAESPIPNPPSSISNIPPQTFRNDSNYHSTSAPEQSTPVETTSGYVRFLIRNDVSSRFSGRRDSTSVSPTPGDFTLAKEDESSRTQRMDQAGAEQVSAADYDPSLDRREDENKRLGVELKVIYSDKDIEEVDEADDVDDMFAISTMKKGRVRKVKVGSRYIVSRSQTNLTCPELCLTCSDHERDTGHCCGS